MKPRRLFATLVLAVLGALLIAGPTAAATAVHLEGTLTGEQEVPGPGDRNGSGKAVLRVSKTRVCYALRAERIERPTAAHIHVGRPGVAGPIVVTLNTPQPVSGGEGFASRGCERIERGLSRNLRMHPARYYVNVHNNQFEAGAIRGQLHR